MPREYKRLRYPDRKTIEKCFKENKSIEETAEIIGVHRDTIYKELHRQGMTKGTYRADIAQKAL